jgi:polyribonucleotide nucleotidyltransferase
MAFVRETVMLGGKELSIETGRMAKQADGSVVVRYGDTMVLVTAVANRSKRDIDFMPLTCEYQEKTSSSGKIPGGYFKREGRPTEAEILTCRLMDRPTRPLFPKGWKFETQLIALVISTDKENPSDVLAMLGTSTALTLSDIPWAGPYAAVRVGRVDGQFVINPTFAQSEQSEINIVMACSRDAIVMVEGSAKGASESTIVDGLYWGHEQAQVLLDLQEKLRAAVGKPKRACEPPAKDVALYAKVAELGGQRLKDAFAIRGKHERRDAISGLHANIAAGLMPEYAGREKDIDAAYSDAMKKYSRELVLSTATRIDGRTPTEIRQITTEVGVLPRTHGSALFTRGETQALVTVTLGTSRDEQRIDSLLGDITKRFMLHYNFAPFSTGEAKMMRGASRREIGHGNLAERALKEVLPAQTDFPYVIRIVSETLESNGSSSMAAVCGGCMALMDAGVPIKAPVAGIAMGLIYEKTDSGTRFQILSDILGDEDHLGDMDFKVTGTKNGINSFQMDIKIQGLPREVMEKALAQAKEGRLHILDKMAETLGTPRDNLGTYAPRIITVQVKPDKIRDIIGPGGKMIRAIIEQTGVAIDVEDDGTVAIASSDEASAQKALAIIKGLTQEPEVGEFYMGTVKRIAEFGAFVEILPGTDGLVHISEIAAERIRRVEDVLKEGDEVLVKVIAVDKMGKIRLSRKEALGKTPEVVHNSNG